MAAVRDAISACGHDSVAMADFPAADMSSAELCCELVRSCNVYIGVLGVRYGSVVPDMEVSYTELEFDTATDAGMTRLVFLFDLEADLGGIPPSRLIDMDNIDKRQLAFRSRVQASLAAPLFTDPDTLQRLADRSLRYLATRGTQAVTPPGTGRLLTDVKNPFDLEVHRPVRPTRRHPGLPELPGYVRRDHDDQLAEEVRAAAAGTSGTVVLVGGSSTGKTRACWEALDLLRDLPAPWRLWHPISPSRPEAALRELPSVGPRTVVWLNEAQAYLDAPEGGTGEQVAAGLRELLRDPDRRPVLVLATLWPQFWDTLTTRPPGGHDDVHAQARELLASRSLVIPVPSEFSQDQVERLTESRDPRLALAAATAQDGEVIQFLAGATALLDRYRNAPPAAKELIHAAMDARRLGMGIGLPLDFLEAAAPGYLTPRQWDALDDDWLEQALDYVAADAKGTRGPLTPIRPYPSEPHVTVPGPVYRLADYLDQHGRHSRRSEIPPAEFWTAAAGLTDPGDLAALAGAAEDRGLLRDAARLRKRAIARGSASAAAALIETLHSLHPGDTRPAAWAAERAAVADPTATARLLNALDDAGAVEQVKILAPRAAVESPVDNPTAIAGLLKALHGAGAAEQVKTLSARAAAGAPLDHPTAVATLLSGLREAGAADQITALLNRDPAGHARLDNPDAVARLLDEVDQVSTLAARAAVGAPLDGPAATAAQLDALRVKAAEQFEALAALAAEYTPPDNLTAVLRLLEALQAMDAAEHAKTLAARIPLSDPAATVVLLDVLLEAGAADQVGVLLARDPAGNARLGNPDATAGLLLALQRAAAADPRAAGQVRALAARAAAHMTLDDPDATATLFDALWQVGAADHISALTERHPLDDPGGTGVLLDALLAAHAAGQAAALLARDPAGKARLGNPDTTLRLLLALRHAQSADLGGATYQVKVLTERAAAQTPLGNPSVTAWLLRVLHRAGASGQVTGLLARDPAGEARLDDPSGTAVLLDALREAGAVDQVGVLLARDPAGRVSADSPEAAAKLLHALERAGSIDPHAAGQVETLTGRVAAHTLLDNPAAAVRLLDRLRVTGAADLAETLTKRLPAHGQFDLFAKQAGHRVLYRFGCQRDGRPASEWGWSDIQDPT